MIRAGVSRKEITPPLGEELAGYPHYPRNNTGAHDPLYAAAMYLCATDREITMVTLDLLFFSKQHVKETRRRIHEQCGIEENHIMISCSHTHSGPWASGRLDIESLESGKKQTASYIEFLISQIVFAVTEAKANAFEAEFATTTGICGAESGVGGNRRMPGGPHDPLVSVLAVRDMEKNVRGVFVNYTLHPTFIHEWSTVVTADYPCYLKKAVEEQWNGAVVGFAQGASGNQSSRYYRQGESFDEAERVGRKIGEAAVRALLQAEWKDDLTIGIAGSEVEVELRDFGKEEDLVERVCQDTQRYEELYAKYGQSKVREEYYLWQNANLKMLGSEDQLGYVRLNTRGIKIELKEDEIPAEVQLIRIGDVLIVGCPGEVFVEYALYVKAMAGFDMVVFNELANGCLPGYLYTPQSLVTGGYETDTSMLAEGFGKKMVDEILRLSRTL